MGSSRKRFWFCFDCYVRSEEEKEVIATRVDAVRRLLTATGQPTLDNTSLLSAMLDVVGKPLYLQRGLLYIQFTRAKHRGFD